MDSRRELYPGFSLPPLSLGGAPLGGLAPSEAHAILRVAAEAGIGLVDTSSAYGQSEAIIGESPVELSVATKFGNPCGLNCHKHDYSVGHCAQALYASLEALNGKHLACLQLHSPPEHPSPLVPALVDLLHSLRAAGKFGAWGASVHTVNGGMVALSAGAQMLQVPFNLLQQENGTLLAMCSVSGVGTLIQSSLCQGWLTAQGVAAARLLLSAPHRVPPTVEAHGGRVDFHALLRRVLELDALAACHGLKGGLAEMAVRFALHAPGATSVLVQVRTAAQLQKLVGIDLSPLPGELQTELVRSCAAVTAEGTLVHGAGEHLWHWGVPTPRACIESVARRGYTGGAAALLDAALGGGSRSDGDDGATADFAGTGSIATASSAASSAAIAAAITASGSASTTAAASARRQTLRRRFIDDGFVCLRGAFPRAFAAQLASGAFSQPRVSGRWHAYRTFDYFRTDVCEHIDDAQRPECLALEEAMEAILDASLFGADDVYADGFLRSSSVLDVGDDARLFRHSVVGHRASDAPAKGPWAPPDGLRERTYVPIGCTNGWHIDDGSMQPPDFTLASYLRAPWLIAVVLLTDVSDDGGPTTLCPGTHHTMARLLSVCPPGGLTTSSVYSICSCVYTWWCGFGGHAAAAAAAAGGGSRGGGGSRDSSSSGSSGGGSNGHGATDGFVRATGRAGDVYLMHPMLLHTATISTTGEARAILNMPLPYAQANLSKLQGSLSGVTLPILQAQSLRHWTPRPLLWLLWRLAIAFGWLHRETRGTRGGFGLGCLARWYRARAWLLYPVCALSLLLCTLCFWALDAATRHSTHADHMPLIDDGRKGASCRDVLVWLRWLASSKTWSQMLAGWMGARWMGTRRGGARGGAVLPAGRCESPAELRPLVEQ